MAASRFFGLFFLSLLLICFPIKESVEVKKNMEGEKETQEQGRVCFQDFCFEVEIARTAAERRRGLMFRESLGENKGMLFDFGWQENHSFWMKNTLIPLDIIWLNNEKRVVFIKENAQPCGQGLCESINPGALSSYVLEINAGMAEKIGLSSGAQMVFKTSSD